MPGIVIWCIVSSKSCCLESMCQKGFWSVRPCSIRNSIPEENLAKCSNKSADIKALNHASTDLFILCFRSVFLSVLSQNSKIWLENSASLVVPCAFHAMAPVQFNVCLVVCHSFSTMEAVSTLVLMTNSSMCKILSWCVKNATNPVWHVLEMQLRVPRVERTIVDMKMENVWKAVPKDSLLIQMNSATLVIHHAATAMMTVQVHAPHVELKMTNSCCSCTRVSAWHPVRVASLQTLETMNANFVMAPVEVVLVLHHLSASLVIREGFFSVVVLVSVSYIALKVSYSSACVLGCHLTTASSCNYFHQVKSFKQWETLLVILIPRVSMTSSFPSDVTGCSGTLTPMLSLLDLSVTLNKCTDVIYLWRLRTKNPIFPKGIKLVTVWGFHNWARGDLGVLGYLTTF